jgi:plastocyanin
MSAGRHGLSAVGLGACMCALAVAVTLAPADSIAGASDAGLRTHPTRACERRQRDARKKRCARRKRVVHPRVGTAPTSASSPSTPGAGGGGSPSAPTAPGGENVPSEETTSPSEETTQPPPSAVPVVQVTAVEYHYTLSRTTVPAGKVILEFVNRGQDEHNLNVQPSSGASAAAFPTVTPGTVTKMEVELRPGTYTLFCSLPGHEAKGMKASLTVE